MDGDDTIGTLIAQSMETISTTDDMDTFVNQSSYPSYGVDQIRTMTRDCDQEYRLYHADFIGDPIHDTAMYLSYVFLSTTPTTSISYLTTSKKLRSKRDDARQENF